MPTRAEIVREARTWINTPFHHQGRVKKVGVDCVGVVVGVATALGIPIKDATDYGLQADGKRLIAECNAQFVAIPIEQMQPGDIAVFRFEVEPQHVALIGDYPEGRLSVIHAYNTIGRVVESNLKGAERRRIVAAYSFPGVSA